MNVPTHAGDEAQFLERVMRFQDGQLSAVEVEELDRDLRASAELRRVFRDAQMRAMLLHESLRREAYQPGARAADQVEQPDTIRGPRVNRLSRIPWSAAVCLSLLATLAGYWLSQQSSRDATMAHAMTIPTANLATLVAQQDCQWETKSPYLTGQRLGAGELTLRRGRALVLFDGGARMALRAPVQVVLESAGSARVISGQVAVQATEEAIGFRLATRQGTAIDLGTEFVVAVGDTGEAVCSVIEGAVEWHAEAPSSRLTRLVAGEARRFDGAQISPEEFVPLAFADFAPPTSRGQESDLLAYEPFDYSKRELPVEVLDGGSGWQTAWRGRFVPTDKIDVDPVMQLAPDEALTFPGLATGTGGALRCGSQRVYRLRALARPLEFDRDSVHYFSFLMVPQPWSSRGPMRLEFRSTADYWNHSLGWSLGTSSRPFILANGNNSAGGVPLTPGETVFVVGKIATSKSGPDQIFLKVYREGDPLEADETSRWTAASRDLWLDCTLDYLVLAIPRHDDGRFDELRHGTSWNSVVPLVDQPLEGVGG